MKKQQRKIKNYIFGQMFENTWNKIHLIYFIQMWKGFHMIEFWYMNAIIFPFVLHQVWFDYVFSKA